MTTPMTRPYGSVGVRPMSFCFGAQTDGNCERGRVAFMSAVSEVAHGPASTRSISGRSNSMLRIVSPDIGSSLNLSTMSPTCRVISLDDLGPKCLIGLGWQGKKADYLKEETVRTLQAWNMAPSRGKAGYAQYRIELMNQRLLLVRMIALSRRSGI